MLLYALIRFTWVGMLVRRHQRRHGGGARRRHRRLFMIVFGFGTMLAGLPAS